jgi:two-component system sensor histidine kinase TctE
LAPAVGRRGETRSLFGEILDWMFAPLLLLWPMSVSITYLVAQSIANTPYDQALIERAEALAARVQFDGDRAHFDLSPGLLEIYGDGRKEPATYTVADRAGVILAGDPDLHRPQPGLRADSFQLRQDSLRGHPVHVAYAWVYPPASQAAIGPVLVEAAEPPDERTRLANNIVKGVILPQFVVLPLALALVWFGLTRGLAPLARLQQTIRNRPAQDLSHIDTASAPEELAPLVSSFNDLLERTAQALQMQRRFIADAAHQMKTPLAGLRTQAELALRQDDAIERQRSLLQIAESTERATRMVNQMLALARTEHGDALPTASAILDLGAVARCVVQDWVDIALAQHIDLGFEADDVPVRITGTDTLLREMLNNLVDNAIRYCRTPSADRDGLHDSRLNAVTVRVKTNQQQALLEVEDTGPGIAPAERPLVFERFYRVLGTGRDGSGLGLAIVREIVNQHHGQIELTDGTLPPNAPGWRRGCLFRVRLPLAN